MSEQEGSLREEFKRLNENLTKLLEENKAKKVSLPFWKKLGKNKVKKGWIYVFTIGENRNLEIVKVQVEEQTAMLNGCPRIASSSEMLTYKNKPALLVPEWSVWPISPTELYKAAAANNTLTVGFRLLLNKMKMEAIKAKKNLSTGLIIFGLLALAGLGYYMYKSGAFS